MALKTAVVPDVVSILEPVSMDTVCSHWYGERIIFHLHQEGGLEAVYIRRGWIIVSIYSSAQSYSNSPALPHSTIHKGPDHLDVPWTNPTGPWYR